MDGDTQGYGGSDGLDEFAGGLSQESLLSALGPHTLSQSQSQQQQPPPSLSQQSQPSLLPFSQESIYSQIPLYKCDNKGASYTQTKSKNADPTDDYFLCEYCASEDSYIDDTTGALTCSVCFMQSQAFVAASQQDFEYEDAMGMAARARDGRLIQSQQSQSQLSEQMLQSMPPELAAAERKRRRGGRPQKASHEYDTSQPLPSLAECLLAFQTVLREACKVVCLDLLPLALVVKCNGGNSSDASSLLRQQRKQQRQTILKQVLKAVKALWKAYLESWQEGAEYYGARYPQMRFALRDAFMNGFTLRNLHKVLAGRVATQVKTQVEQEEDQGDDDDGSHLGGAFDDEDASDLSDSDQDNNHDDDDDDDDDDDYDDYGTTSRSKRARRGNPKSSDASTLTGRSGDQSRRSLFTSLSRNTSRSRKSRSDDDLSYDCDVMVGEDIDISANEEESVHSELSQAEHKRQHHGRKHYSRLSMPPITKLVYLHCREKRGKGGKIKLGRKEAALILPPSMRMTMGMIWIAVAPFGVTSSHLINWVTSGALPILNAYSSMLVKGEKEPSYVKLKSIACFFRLRNPPTVEQLKRIVRCLHVSCGYMPPSVQLKTNRRQIIAVDSSSEETNPRTIEELELTEKSILSEPGRLLRPSNVPLVLAQLVFDLGLGQTVLNYSLALMGLPVAERALPVLRLPRKKKSKREREIETGQEAAIADGSGMLDSDSDAEDKEGEEIEKRERWLPPPLPSARPDKSSEISNILACVIVACKLIPGWDKNLVYKRPSLQSSAVAREECDDGDDGDYQDMKAAKEDGRFIPWTQERFTYIGNGTLESDYLDFLEETIINLGAPTLPKTASSFATTISNKELPTKSAKDQHTVRQNNAIVTVQRRKQCKRSLKNVNEKPSVECGIKYQRTFFNDSTKGRPIPPPTGTLLEYIAMKSGENSQDIVHRLVQLEDELANSKIAMRK